MAKFKLLTPVNLILAGLILIVITQFGSTQTLSAVDLTDPATNKTYSCQTTFECYQKIQGQISDRGPALACTEGKCVVQNCVEGEETTKICPDGTKIVLKNCIAGEWEFTNNVCLIECTSNSQCISAADTDCDGELDPSFGQCVSNTCQFQTAPRCSETELFWNKYKWYLIAGTILILGLGGFMFKEKLLKVF